MHGFSQWNNQVWSSYNRKCTYININVEFGDGEGQISVDNIARKAEDYRYNKKVT